MGQAATGRLGGVDADPVVRYDRTRRSRHFELEHFESQLQLANTFLAITWIELRDCYPFSRFNLRLPAILALSKF